MNGKDLERRRKELGYSKRKFSEALRIRNLPCERMTIYRWENGISDVPGWMDMVLEVLPPIISQDPSQDKCKSS